MVVYRGEVSHRLARRQLLAQWQQGAITRDTVCDADFLLVTAANFHGQQDQAPWGRCRGGSETCGHSRHDGGGCGRKGPGPGTGHPRGEAHDGVMLVLSVCNETIQRLTVRFAP